MNKTQNKIHSEIVLQHLDVLRCNSRYLRNQTMHEYKIYNER